MFWGICHSLSNSLPRYFAPTELGLYVSHFYRYYAPNGALEVVLPTGFISLSAPGFLNWSRTWNCSSFVKTLSGENGSHDWKWSADLREVSSPEMGRKAVDIISSHIAELIKEALETET